MLLKTAGYNELYPRQKRDLIISKCIIEEKTVQEANNILKQYDFKKVGNADNDELF